jgi:aminopeptidase N
MPISVGLVGTDGKDMPLKLRGEEDEASPQTTKTLRFSDAEATFVFEDVASKPTPSILRDFSAPVRLKTDLGKDDLIFLMANDSDLFNKWEAGQTLFRETLLQLIDDVRNKKTLVLDDSIVAAMRVVVAGAVDADADKAFIARAMALPSESELSELCSPADPDVIREARDFVVVTLAKALRKELEAGLEANSAKTYARDGPARAARSLKNACLSFLSRLEDETVDKECARRFKEADNMTDQVAALGALVSRDCAEREEALDAFYEQWKHDPLIMNKWLGLQASASLPNNVENVKALMKHPAFDVKNPNKVYSLIGGFVGGCPSNFHDASGSGYEFLGDVVLQLDAINGSVAARMVAGFTRWRKYDEKRQALMKAQLERIVNKEGLSENVYEIVAKSLE